MLFLSFIVHWQARHGAHGVPRPTFRYGMYLRNTPLRYAPVWSLFPQNFAARELQEPRGLPPTDSARPRAQQRETVKTLKKAQR